MESSLWMQSWPLAVTDTRTIAVFRPSATISHYATAFHVINSVVCLIVGNFSILLGHCSSNIKRTSHLAYRSLKTLLNAEVSPKLASDLATTTRVAVINYRLLRRPFVRTDKPFGAFWCLHCSVFKAFTIMRGTMPLKQPRIKFWFIYLIN